MISAAVLNIDVTCSERVAVRARSIVAAKLLGFLRGQ